jgi:hypothetical protein
MRRLSKKGDQCEALAPGCVGDGTVVFERFGDGIAGAVAEVGRSRLTLSLNPKP